MSPVQCLKWLYYPNVKPRTWNTLTMHTEGLNFFFSLNLGKHEFDWISQFLPNSCVDMASNFLSGEARWKRNHLLTTGTNKALGCNLPSLRHCPWTLSTSHNLNGFVTEFGLSKNLHCDTAKSLIKKKNWNLSDFILEIPQSSQNRASPGLVAL
jgi:hypothetical protein